MTVDYFIWGFGLILLLSGIWGLIAGILFIQRSIKTDGRFDHWEMARPEAVGSPTSSRGRSSFRAVVTYAAADGSEHRIKSATWTQTYYKPKVPSDRAVPVRYDSQNPKDARVFTFMDFWFFRLLSLLIGAALLALAISRR